MSPEQVSACSVDRREKGWYKPHKGVCKARLCGAAPARRTGRKDDVRMRILTALLQLALWLWFLGCITTYRLGGRVLVEGMGVRSAEFFMLCLFSVGLVCFYGFPFIGKWLLSGILIFWLAVQFLCHWRYTLFGASREKLASYHACFQNTVRLFPERKDRIVPDLYHAVIHLLILLNLLCCAGR